MYQTEHELTKKDTKMIQGVAILAMVILHLFDTLEYQGKFVPLLSLFGYPVVFYFAQLSDFCVMAFAFCSGYAHMTQHKKPGYFKNRLTGLLGVYLNYWIILILFTLISFIIGNGKVMPESFPVFLGNFTTVHLTYNGAWWYLFTYALITLASPLLLRASENKGVWKTIIVLVCTATVYCGAYFVRTRLDSNNWLFYQIGLFGMTAAEYMMGSIACEYKVFRRIGTVWDKLFKNSILSMGISLIIIAFLLWSRTVLIPALFFAPLSGAVIIFLFWKNKKAGWIESVFQFLGKQATNIWLTHMFFYATIFVGLAYRAKYPVLILLFMLAITIPISVAINAFFVPLFSKIRKRLSEQKVIHPDNN